MHFLSSHNFRFNLTIFLLFIFQVANARQSGKVNQSCKKPRLADNSSSNGDTWELRSHSKGSKLLDFFKFETSNQGSQGGSAQYVDLQEGYRSAMIGAKNGILYFGVDVHPQDTKRKSFRMSSKETFSAGTLLVVDVHHMPVACGVWPSLWTVSKSEQWPEKGEIDIIEGVNLFTQNSLSVHTKPGFSIKSEGFGSKFMLKGDKQANCDSSATEDQGCGLRDSNTTSFGQPFNAAGGGFHVLEWTNQSISIYFFPRGHLPTDIASGKPSKSSSWGQPRAKFQGRTGQSTADYFKDHVLVVNTNLCGKWPEAVWNSNTSYAGQSQSCAAITGYPTCPEFVSNEGEKLREAYWAIKSVRVYT